MKTSRLHLRRFTPEDWRDLHEYLSDAEVVKYEPYAPATPEESKEIASQRAASDAFWAVCLLENNKLIGNVYFAEGGQQTWEAGYVFNRLYQGKGYATEAVAALIDDAFENKRAHRIFAQCNPENTASWRLLERLHFRREGHLKRNVYFFKASDGTPLWQDTFLYGLLAEDWREGQSMVRMSEKG